MIQHVGHSLRFLTSVNDNGSPRSLCSPESCFPKQKQSDPTIREQEARLISIHRPKEMISDSVELCETEVCFLHIQLIEQMYDFQKRTMFLQKWILNLQDLPQNQSLETVPVCIVCSVTPHNNIVCIDMYDECKKSIDSGVCHMLWSIL